MLVKEVAPPGPDAAGNSIDKVYARNPPDYAIYQSDGQVLVHLADDPQRAKAQAVALAPLGVLRGEIDALIDGWRSDPKRQAKAGLLQRGIARALNQALQGDVAGARQSLEEIKQSILAERTSVARFEYMIVAAACFLAIFLFTDFGLLGWKLFYPNAETEEIRTVVGAGAMGAFFSIATGLRNRTVLPDLRYLDNAADAMLRMVIGAIGAGTALALYEVGLVKLQLPAAPGGGLSGSALFVVGFLAGFSERLVPDLLAKTAQTASAASAAAGAAPINAATASAAAQLSQPAASASAASATTDAPDDHDGCLSDSPPAPGEAVTRDEELPAAEGGLAAADQGHAAQPADSPQH